MRYRAGPAGRELPAAESGEMASVDQCRVALDELIAVLASVDPVLRAKHVPERTVACRVEDLDLTFVGRLDEHGLHDLAESVDGSSGVDVRVSMSSDELVALAEGSDDFLHAWLRGRIQVSASMRDLLRLRSLFSV
jgi:predicted lipid carrier protein YhbT